MFALVAILALGADPTDWEKQEAPYLADIKQVTVEERDEHGRPSRVHFTTAAFGRSTHYTLAYDYREAPRMLAWRLTEGDITSKLDGCYVFDPADGGGTEITYHLVVDLKVPLPGFVKRRAEGRIMGTALRELKARVEGSPAPSPPASA